MKLKNSIYEDFDGTHWPDAIAGAVEWHSIDFEACLTDKNATLEKVYWFIDKGVSTYDQVIDGTKAGVKLALLHPGIFKVTCKAYLKNENAEQETQTVRLIIRVY